MDYVSIRVSTLRGEQKIDFNAYVKINDKMVLYLRRGDSFEGDRLKRLKDRKLRKMYILTDDESRYLSYLQQNIEIAYDSKSGQDMQSRAEVIQGSQQNNAEEVFENPDSVESYTSAKDAAAKYVDFLMNNTEALSAIMNVENVDKNVAHHGVTVATLSIALAKKLGLDDPKKTQLLTLGALLHDYGHHGTNLDVNQALDKMSPADLELWKQHPQQGALKVQDKKHFDQAVINIIAQHEEAIDGTGPKRMFEKDLDPLSILVSSSNAVDRLITFEGIPKTEAVKRLTINQVGRHPLRHIQFLGEILKGT
jgi:putative nucleotidyltransferase with HDIG domain